MGCRALGVVGFLAALSAGPSARAQAVPAPWAMRLVGCWQIDPGHRVRVAQAAGGLSAQLEGYGADEALNPMSYSAADRLAWFAPPLAVQAARVSFALQPAGVELALWRYDHSRLLRGPVRHPLRAAERRTITRCT